MLAVIFEIICHNGNLMPIPSLKAGLYFSNYSASYLNIVYMPGKTFSQRFEIKNQISCHDWISKLNWAQA